MENYQFIKKYWPLAQRVGRGDFSGLFTGKLKGSGLELKELRPYTVGDDAKNIDWKSTARLGRVHVKEFNEERSVRLLLVLDLTPTLYANCGRPEALKSELLFSAAFMLAWVALKSGDQVGWLINASPQPRFITFSRSYSQLWQVMKQLHQTKIPASVGAQSSCPLGDLLEKCHNFNRRAAEVVLLSDFLNLQAADYPLVSRRIKALKFRDHLLALQISDPLEKSLPDCGLLWFMDPLNFKSVLIDTSAVAWRQEYEDYAKKRSAHLKQLFRQNSVPLEELEVGGDPLAPLARLLSGDGRKNV